MTRKQRQWEVILYWKTEEKNQAEKKKSDILCVNTRNNSHNKAFIVSLFLYPRTTPSEIPKHLHHIILQNSHCSRDIYLQCMKRHGSVVFLVNLIFKSASWELIWLIAMNAPACHYSFFLRLWCHRSNDVSPLGLWRYLHRVLFMRSRQ